MIFQMTCGARWNGIGFDVVGGKLTLDKFGHIFSVHELTPSVQEQLEYIKRASDSNDEGRTIAVIQLANQLENEIDA